MATSNLTLELERARAEAASRVVRTWELSEDLADQARLLEAHIVRNLLDTPVRLQIVVKTAFTSLSRAELNADSVGRYRESLSDCFRFNLDVLRLTRDLAWQSQNSGYLIPSLPPLEKTISEVESLEARTLNDLSALDTDVPTVVIDPSVR
jgi:hypothetical protein